MKTAKYNKYGSPDVIQIIDQDKPTPREDEILIKVHASSLSPAECAFRKGKPFIVRFFAGLTAPKATPGDMFAGTVQAVGKEVHNFTPGDRVFGSTAPATGSHAEYLVMKSDQTIARLPEILTFEEGTSIADGGITALPFLRDNGQIKSGDHILINGASGSIGTYAIQLAKNYNATVTAVCSKRNHELVRNLGADYVIDYTQQDFAANHHTYDIIFDAVGKRSYNQCKGALKEGGKYLTTVPTAAVIFFSLLPKSSKRKRPVFAATGLRKPEDKIPDLTWMAQLAAEGNLKTVIDKTYTFDTIREGHAYVDEGHKVGNVILRIVGY